MEETKKKVDVRISRDEMEAFVMLDCPAEGETYTKTDVLVALSAYNVTYGIDEKKIQQIIDAHLFEHEICVAEGKPSQDGVDGFFQYNFNLEFNNKPTVREDGSVDYWSVHAVEIVEEGQVIAVYHDPVEGHDGMNVFGRPILCKRGRALPPLAGRGFNRAEDGHTYTAAINGKIEMNNNRVIILPVYEISGDVDLTTGNIEFRGDVIVHGNVAPGASIQATGSVTIDGLTQSCTIDAGKDVILRGGFLGGGKGIIRSKANVTAKFIEYGTVEAEGSVEVTSALNSNIVSYDHVRITGKTANIVGGSVYGASGVDAYSMGTEAEVRTHAVTGVTRQMREEYGSLKEQAATLQKLMERINFGLKQLEGMENIGTISEQYESQKVSLLRTKIAKQAEQAKTMEAIMRLETIMDRCKEGKIRVLREVYPGVVVEINSCKHAVNDLQRSVEFKEEEAQIRMYAITDDVIEGF